MQVRFQGALSSYGIYDLEVFSISQGLGLLLRQIKGLAEDLRAHDWQILLNGQACDLEQLHWRLDGDVGAQKCRNQERDSCCVDFVPLVQGAKRAGLGKVLTGVVLVAASIATAGVGAGGIGAAFSGTAIGGGSAFAATIAGVGLKLGVGLALSGVGQMMTPESQIAETRLEDRESYLYRGPTNAVGQGQVLPMVYGSCIIGGSLINQTIDVQAV